MSDGPHLARLGQWIASLEEAAIPASARRAARLQILDMVAAAHAGGRTADAAAVAAGAADFGGEGKATILATGERRAPADALLVNAACSMAQDFDDVVWMGHTCHSAVFAALAVAEHEGAQTTDLVTAVVVANEIGGRLGASSLLGPLNGQMWTFVHHAAAAAATARLLRLDAERATHALAVALAQPNFALQPGFLAPSSKLLAASTPAATGMQAAYLARAGVTGAPALLEDRRGFWRRFSYLPLPFMLDGLGDFWTMETLQVKTYPGCHYFQTACTALEALLELTGPLRPDDVRRIRIETTKLGAEATRFGGEYGAGEVTAVNACFDLATAAAVLLCAGRLTGEEVEPRFLGPRSPEIRSWRERITVEHAPELTARVIASTRSVAGGRAALRAVGPRDMVALGRRYREEYGSTLLSAREAAGWLRLAARRLARGGRRAQTAPRDGAPEVVMAFPNRVTLELADGRTLTDERDVPTGCVALPEMERELERKFLRETAPRLGPERASAAFAAGLALDSIPLPHFVDLIST